MQPKHPALRTRDQQRKKSMRACTARERQPPWDTWGRAYNVLGRFQNNGGFSARDLGGWGARQAVRGDARCVEKLAPEGDGKQSAEVGKRVALFVSVGMGVRASDGRPHAQLDL